MSISFLLFLLCVFQQEPVLIHAETNLATSLHMSSSNNQTNVEKDVPTISENTEIKLEYLSSQERESGGIALLMNDIYSFTMYNTGLLFGIFILPSIVLFITGMGLLVYYKKNRKEGNTPKTFLLISVALVSVPIILNVLVQLLVEFVGSST
jgi:hypothetical protein